VLFFAFSFSGLLIYVRLGGRIRAEPKYDRGSVFCERSPVLPRALPPSALPPALRLIGSRPLSFQPQTKKKTCREASLLCLRYRILSIFFICVSSFLFAVFFFQYVSDNPLLDSIVGPVNIMIFTQCFSLFSSFGFHGLFQVSNEILYRTIWFLIFFCLKMYSVGGAGESAGPPPSPGSIFCQCCKCRKFNAAFRTSERQQLAQSTTRIDSLRGV
jgi:hypothetical protein